MVAVAITILALNFIAQVWLRSVNRWMAYLHLFVLFIFAFVVSSKEFSTFYLIMFIIAVLLTELVPKLNTEKQSDSLAIGSNRVAGIVLTALFIGVGVLIYGIIALISTTVGGNIVGVPNLALTSTSQIAEVFKPTFESMLAFVENMFAFVLFDMFLLLGGVFFIFNLIPIISQTAVSALIFAVYHVAAYDVNVGLIIWSFLAFSIFILSRFAFKNSTPADTAHVLNNAFVSLSRSLQIVT